jgi:hypothetical protein
VRGAQGGVAGVQGEAGKGGRGRRHFVGEKHGKHTTWAQRIRHITVMRRVCWMHARLVVDQAVGADM